ncbi:UDP-N-acetylglucosamine-N-acetylmuramylpentapeptide N-acetylglucosamine transferase [Hathewaya proteolytica DSM 3090]|uniref:UDP-N-acetylglucosamine--N-acetylmuramyl-(pentapeptide) pyrophosphoryl-undecaprenol N-acetylglucosamine transferase n=1 Tax=Hathewaya proteolytica DSM 3090 TaxID=1121331 RepID=A0A1M6LD55_9CLOT|nr:undecaprenyldiphospho-muramoylpentapeptide beta-N-acetylglucosaminyltransferase [Hathewaya proteolytica]SHJ69171.1 UDP-N-acetylglucosamine-N-acetylmuramylpentapeptide N-acetylglucosamine transferase [Hathewaya proteolytica DSM 3090]
MTKHKIILTGGGSAGHVTPNLALVPRLKEMEYQISYIGSISGIEKNIIENANIKYFGISSGKLRRGKNIKNLGRNFLDVFRVGKGILDAKRILKKEKPDIVFSKGGFVSVPVVMAASMLNIPVIAHECDITPGLANKLASRYCDKICVTFEETLKYVDKNKGCVTGLPIRSELFTGKRSSAVEICGFKNSNKPILLVIGGSLGAKCINEIVRKNIQNLLKEYNIIHICGKGNMDTSIEKMEGYYEVEYANEELKHFMNAADYIISRAGANFIFEILSLKKPNLLIPLSKKASRGDQILNAESFRKKGYSIVIEEENLNSDILMEKLQELRKNQEVFIKNMENSNLGNATEKILQLIEKSLKHKA